MTGCYMVEEKEEVEEGMEEHKTMAVWAETLEDSVNSSNNNSNLCSSSNQHMVNQILMEVVVRTCMGCRGDMVSLCMVSHRCSLMARGMGEGEWAIMYNSSLIMGSQAMDRWEE